MILSKRTHHVPGPFGSLETGRVDWRQEAGHVWGDNVLYLHLAKILSVEWMSFDNCIHLSKSV